MSIVGYILGLGDRRPSNIMLDRVSGKIIHVDFGDCFEVSMKREKFPEKVPFRLTRMLIKALEIGGIEGTFRITCENVMRVMRENKDSLNVILAAFVHDPLTSFRLLIPLIMKNVKNKNKNEEKNNKFGEDKAIKGNKPQLNKSRTNSTIATVSSERANKNLNRVASCETGKNKNKIKRNNEIKKINYYFSKPKYMMQINNFINEDKKLRENKNIINNISLSAFLKNKNNNELSENKVNTFNLSNLIVQNLNNKVDKEIKYRNDDNDLYN